MTLKGDGVLGIKAQNEELPAGSKNFVYSKEVPGLYKRAEGTISVPAWDGIAIVDKLGCNLTWFNAAKTKIIPTPWKKIDDPRCPA